MHQRIFRGSALAALVIAIALIAASAATAGGSTTTTMTSNQTFGTTSCPTMTGPGFQQNGYCFFFPNGSATPSALCDPMFCGSETYNLTNPGTFTATLTYPSPNGFTLLGLELCQNGQAAPDPATCPQTMSPGGAEVPGCTQDFVANDNGTPADPTDDTMTTTLTCPITAADTVNSYTLIVYPIAVLNCADVTDPLCAADITQGTTAALLVTYTSTVTTGGPAGAAVEGGGDVAPQQHFSLEGQNDPSKWNHAHVHFVISSNDVSRCQFKADSATLVDVEPTPLSKSGGTATMQGSGVVTDFMKIKHQVTYQLHVTDGGKSGTDTFQLNAPGCDTHGLVVPVQHGNIVVHQHGQ
jgi:hypothetical protein